MYLKNESSKMQMNAINANKRHVEFTDDMPFERTLKHIFIACHLAKLFNPLSISKCIKTDYYAEGRANGFDFATFQVERDLVMFVKKNPVIWDILVDRDYWHATPVDQSFVKGSTPLSCFYECKSILSKQSTASFGDKGLADTIDYYIAKLEQQPAFSFDD